MRLVFIEWQDSHGSESRWSFASDVPRAPLVCRSVGWLIHEDDQCKTIVPHLTSEDHPTAEQQAWGDMTIPTRAIMKIVELPLTSF